ncbi:helix-turn-helix domain-containing protein [Sorangium sp. So ce1128]
MRALRQREERPHRALGLGRREPVLRAGPRHRPPGGAMSVAFGDPGAELPSLKEARDAFERAYLVEVLRRASGNVSAAAKLSGRNRTDFYDLLRKHGLSSASFKE